VLWQALTAIATVVASAAMVTATINGILGMRHRREDDARFAEVHKRITNGDH
jgi:hypothetical protein